MGKASRSKNQSLTSDKKEALACAEEIIFHPKMIPTYLCLNSTMTSYNPPVDKLQKQWAKGFSSVFKNQRFQSLIQDVADQAFPYIWKSDPSEILQFGYNKKPPEDAPELIAVKNLKTRLCANKESPLWTALIICCLARLVGSNANIGFKSNEWSDVTFLWFQLEKALLHGEGKEFATGILHLNDEVMEGSFAKQTGQRIPHGLAELAINVNDTALFA